METIRANLARNPRLAEMLARQGRERFPDSPASDERDMQVVAAAFNQGKMDVARGEAYYYVRNHPNGRYFQDLARLAGVEISPK